MTLTVMSELGEAFHQAKADDAVRRTVLTRSSERAICSGADLGGIVSNSGPTRMHEARGGPAARFKQLWHLGKPTISPVWGFYLVGGFGLALSCDFVVATAD